VVAAAAAAALVLVATPAPAGAAPAPSPATPSNPAVPSAAATPDGQVSWGVAPAPGSSGAARAHFDYTLNPGARITDAMVVTNHSERAITLNVYATDAFTTHGGGIDALPAGAKPTDVGAWIAAGTGTVTVPAGQAVTVPFTLTVPAGATPGDHSGAVLTSLVEDSGSGGVRVDHRLGSRVYVRIAGPLRPALTVTQVHAGYTGTVNPAGTGDVRVTYTVSNTGNVRLSGHQRVTVAGPLGVLSRGVPVADLPEILPGGSLTRTVTVPGVWPAARMAARISVAPVAGAGAPAVRAQPASGSAGLWAPPWGQLLVLVVLVAVVLGLILMRRRHRRAIAAAVSEAVERALNQSHAAAADRSGR
jgi:hypothetical protein